MVEIVGYSTGETGWPNSALSCKRLDEDAEPIGDPFDVFALSIDPANLDQFHLDLQATTTRTLLFVGRQIPVTSLTYKIEGDGKARITCTWPIRRTGCA